VRGGHHFTPRAARHSLREGVVVNGRGLWVWPREHVYVRVGAAGYTQAPLFLERLVGESPREAYLRSISDPEEGWDAWTVSRAFESEGVEFTGDRPFPPGSVVLTRTVRDRGDSIDLLVHVASRPGAAYSQPERLPERLNARV